MNRKVASYPYPVLSVARPGDVDSVISINPEPVINTDGSHYEVDFGCFHDNVAINRLVSCDEAVYMCDVTCGDTMFRTSVTSKVPRFSLKLPRKSLRGNVVVSSYIVAVTSIVGYKNDKAKSLYSKYTFDIGKGEVLAYFGDFAFDADIQYDKLKAVSSLMRIEKNDNIDEKCTIVECDDERIKVFLPAEDYEIFQKDYISRSRNKVPYIHSSIVMNALLVALYIYEDYTDKLWYKAIEYRMKNEEQFLNDSLADKTRIPEIAQKILGYPISRLIKQIDHDSSNYDEDEE